MKYKYLVSVDKADEWERHSKINYIGLYDTMKLAYDYIKTKRDFEKYSITKIPAEPIVITNQKVFAEFGYKMIYNLKTKIIKVYPKSLCALSRFETPVISINYDNNLYDIEIVIPKKHITKDAIELIESQKSVLMLDILNYFNSILFKFYEQNLIICELCEDNQFKIKIVNDDTNQVDIINNFGSFAIFTVSTEYKNYVDNPTPQRLTQSFYKIVDKIS